MRNNFTEMHNEMTLTPEEEAEMKRLNSIYRLTKIITELQEIANTYSKVLVYRLDEYRELVKEIQEQTEAIINQ